MSADRLREAAKVLRERAEAATPGPWVPLNTADENYDTDDGAGWWWVWRKDALPFYGGVMEGESHSPNCAIGTCEITDGREGVKERKDAEYIATMHPGVGLALADWLDDMTQRHDFGQGWCQHCRQNAVCGEGRKALAVADAILGGV